MAKFEQSYQQSEFTATKLEVPHFPICKQTLLNRSTVCYGGTNDGKSSFITHCIYSLQTSVAQIFAVSPSEPSNETYKGIVPPGAIIVDIEKKALQAFVESLWVNQTKMSAQYKRVYDVDILISLYRYVRTKDIDERISRFDTHISKYEKAQNKLNESKSKSFEIEMCKNKITWLINEYKQSIMRTLIHAISEQIRVFESIKLNDEQRFVLKHMHINPHTILIFDDCMAELKSITNKDWFIRLFTRGRHVKLTTLIAAHDDTNLPPDLRKNVFNSVYCNAGIIQSNIGRGGPWSKDDIKHASEYIDKVFGDMSKYNMLVAVRESRYKFRYAKADRYKQPVKIGLPIFWKYMHEVYGDPSRDTGEQKDVVNKRKVTKK